jgi:AcrR family transcriptional regulator
MQLTNRSVRNKGIKGKMMENRSTRVGKKRILEVAEELFTVQGYRAVSIRDIARGCQISSAALYYHFPSKEDLFRSVLEQHAANLNDRMRRAGETPGTFRARISAMLLEYARIAADRRSPIFLIRREPESKPPGLGKAGMHKPHAHLLHAMLLPLEELLRQAIQEGELKRLPEGNSSAALLVGMLHGQIQFKQACQGERVDDADVELVVSVFWEGMEAGGTSK